MKNMQQQTLLAVLLLLLTALAAVGGGMTPREPFMEDHMKDPMDDTKSCKDGSEPNEEGKCPEDKTEVTEVTEVTEGEGFTNCDKKEDVEGFTGSMYAGF